ncbi:hypothetical protein CICLE_v10033913mg, partial [Citrus x clementina]
GAHNLQMDRPYSSKRLSLAFNYQWHLKTISLFEPKRESSRIAVSPLLVAAMSQLGFCRNLYLIITFRSVFYIVFLRIKLSIYEFVENFVLSQFTLLRRSSILVDNRNSSAAKRARTDGPRFDVSDILVMTSRLDNRILGN